MPDYLPGELPNRMPSILALIRLSAHAKEQFWVENRFFSEHERSLRA